MYFLLDKGPGRARSDDGPAAGVTSLPFRVAMGTGEAFGALPAFRLARGLGAMGRLVAAGRGLLFSRMKNVVS
jgi:hypothetical protein